MSEHAAALKNLMDNAGQKEHPAGSNSGPFVQMCQRATWLPGTHWPWCVAAWVWAWTKAGYKLPYKGAGAWAMLDWYSKNAPGWVVPLARAKPGAAVILKEGSGHCAMLAKPYDGHGTVHTVDGNWGDQVSITTHPASGVKGCVDPPEAAWTKPVAKPPLFEVVTSASGHAKVVFVGKQGAVGKQVGKLLNKWGGVTIRRHKKSVTG